MRPRAGSDPVVHATKTALRALGRRVLALDAETAQASTDYSPNCCETATRTCCRSTGSASTPPPPCSSPPATTPTGCARSPPGLVSAVSLPSKPHRARSSDYRLNPGGDRQANAALWHIVITRMSSDPRTRAYVERRSKEGLSKKEIIRVLKRYVAREVYYYLKPL